MSFSNDELQKLIEDSLRLAALKAREVAFQTNTPIVIKIDGEVKTLKVTEQDIEEYRQSIKELL